MAIVKKNKAKERYYFNFEFVKHDVSKTSLNLPSVGQYEVRLLKMHRGTDMSPAYSVNGDSFSDCWATMCKVLNRNEAHLINTLKLDDLS